MAKKKPAAISNGDGTDLAVADPPKRGRGRPPKQPMLNNDPAFENIQELEDLAAALDVARTERIRMGTEESDLEGRLVAAMQKHNLENYKSSVGLVKLTHVDKTKAKIKKPKGAGDDPSEDEED